MTPDRDEIKRSLGDDEPMSDLVYRSTPLLSWRNPMLVPLILVSLLAWALIIAVIREVAL